MLTAENLYVAVMVFVWALLLGIINTKNKLYILMFAWLVLTYAIASVRAVELVFLIITCAMVATIAMCIVEHACISACLWLHFVAYKLALSGVARRARSAPAA
jgi:hypothetical protein